MSRRKRGRAISGMLLLDKPAGISSNLALQKARRALDARKAGHTGTLDPFATGMLPICLGEASKTAAFMLDARKCYRATALLGQSTTTGDLEGEPLEQMPVPDIDAARLEAVMLGLTGTIQQVPPMYSALKHEGKRLYELAREGKSVERPPREITIYRLEVISWSSPELIFEVECSKGTYVRTLAEDIALALGSCAHLVALRRLWVEPFAGQALVSLDDLEDLQTPRDMDSSLLPADAGVASWPQVVVDADGVKAFMNGNPVQVETSASGLVRAYAGNGILLGLADCREGRLQPKRVFLPDSPES